MANVVITPEQVMRKANELSQVAERLDKQVSVLGDIVDEMTTQWTGMGSNAYYNMYVRMEESLRGYPKLLESIAAEAKASAKALDNTDDSVAAGFRG
ncbi:MAG: WXG100 family type VII secretion target [Clostridia bacterium]|nr:WXG100 family type VII secretion target [Clostridia bacterium]